jgi:hypothetical protein
MVGGVIHILLVQQYHDLHDVQPTHCITIWFHFYPSTYPAFYHFRTHLPGHCMWVFSNIYMFLLAALQFDSISIWSSTYSESYPAFFVHISIASHHHWILSIHSKFSFISLFILIVTSQNFSKSVLCLNSFAVSYSLQKFCLCQSRSCLVVFKPQLHRPWPWLRLEQGSWRRRRGTCFILGRILRRSESETSGPQSYQIHRRALQITNVDQAYPPSIIYECIKKLLSNVGNPEEEEIKSLCKLPTAIGKSLDTNKARTRIERVSCGWRS